MTPQEFFETMIGNFVSALTTMRELVQTQQKMCELFVTMANANQKMCDALQLLLEKEQGEPDGLIFELKRKGGIASGNEGN